MDGGTSMLKKKREEDSKKKCLDCWERQNAKSCGEPWLSIPEDIQRNYSKRKAWQLT